MNITLYGGYLLNTEPPRRLVYEPGNPEAVWCIAEYEPVKYRTIQSLVRDLGDGRWELLHHVDNEPLTLTDILGAELKINKWYATEDLRRVVKNHPRKFNHSTKAVTPRPGQKCDRCRHDPKRNAVATLASYTNSTGSTRNITRSFCRGCLQSGEPVTAKRICHLCRKVGAELTIFVEERGSHIHEFRVHRECAADYRSHLEPRPSMDERRPMRRVILTNGET